jgi:hypothetical protein
MRHLVRVSVVVLPPAALAAALAAGCTSAPGHPAAQAPNSSSAAAQPATTSAAGPVPTTAVPAASTHHLGPAATVRAYYRAINNHNYARAWHLGGRFTGSSYPAFAAGFQGTAHDEVSILSVTGNVVTARLAARQTDGSVRTYQGTYWVTHGVITRFDVAPSSAAPPRRRPRPPRPGATRSLPAGTAMSRASTARPPTRVRPAWPVTAKPSCVCWSPAATTGTRWAELCDQRH